MSLGVFAPVLERVEQLRIHSSQASQILSIELVGFVFVGVEMSLILGAFATKTSWPHSFSTLLTHGENGFPLLYCDAQQRLLRGKATSEGFGGSGQPALLHNLAALCVDEAQV